MGILMWINRVRVCPLTSHTSTEDNSTLSNF